MNILPKNVAIERSELGCNLTDECEMTQAAIELVEQYFNAQVLSSDIDFSDEKFIHLNIRWDEPN